MSIKQRDEKTMQQSSVDWIGKIPDDWQINKVGQRFVFMNRKVSDADYEPLSVTYSGIQKRIENAAKSDSGDNRKLLLKGEIAINGRSDRMGAAGLSNYDGSISLIYHVLHPLDEQTDPAFYHYLFRSKIFSHEFYKWGRGIVDDLWTTRANEMRQIPVPVPSTNTQKEIAKFLDSTTEAIQLAIEKRSRQIDLLKEKRAATITEAVTKGLDPDVELVDSGVALLGMIPKGWEVKKLGHIGQFYKGGTLSKTELSEEGEAVLLYGDIYTKFDIQTERMDKFAPKEVAKMGTLIHSNDLLFTGSGETAEDIGKCIVYTGSERAYAGGDVIIFRQKAANSLFLSYQQSSHLHRAEKARYAKGHIVVHIYPSQLKQLPMLLPPIEEQERIASHLNKTTSIIDAAIEKLSRSIALLQEYRTSLISSAVTGKIAITN